MSSSQYVATLRVQGLPDFYFASALTPDGGIPDQFVIMQETLTDAGVDFDRWRDLGQHYQPFLMATIEDDSSYSNGLARKDAYIKAAGKFGTLTYIAGGVTKTFRHVKILGRPAPHPQSPRQQMLIAGGLYGFGASSPSACVLMAMWTLQLTESST